MTVWNRPLAAAVRQRYTIPGYPGSHGFPVIPAHTIRDPYQNHTNENEKERVMAGAEFGKVEVDIVYCVP